MGQHASGIPRRTALLGGGGLVLAACDTSPAGRQPAPAGTPTADHPPASGVTTTSAEPRPTASSVPSVLREAGPDIRTGPATSAAVALTFHGAGELGLTERVLEILRQAQARVTVFAVGQWLATTPQVGRDIVGQGHDLGNHTWSHLAMGNLSRLKAEDEVRRGAEAVAGSVGAPGALFRPSGTPTSTDAIRAAAAAAGYARCISYDVDPEDFLDPGAPLVTSRTLTAVRPGSIVSLHLGHPGTVDALPAILSGLADKRLRATTLTDLLARA